MSGTSSYEDLGRRLAGHLSIEQRSRDGDPTARALLAGLRDGGRRTIGDHTVTWATVVGVVPQELGGRNGNPSRSETSVFHAVTLHALHAQGGKPAHKGGVRPGRAFGQLCAAESDSTRTRVYAAVSSGTTRELVRHLGGLVTMMRRHGIALDYTQLQLDIAGWDDPNRRTQVRLRWGRDMNGALTTTESEEDQS